MWVTCLKLAVLVLGFAERNRESFRWNEDEIKTLFMAVEPTERGEDVAFFLKLYESSLKKKDV